MHGQETPLDRDSHDSLADPTDDSQISLLPLGFSLHFLGIGRRLLEEESSCWSTKTRIQREVWFRDITVQAQELWNRGSTLGCS